MSIKSNRGLNKIVNQIKFQLKAITRKLNIKYQYIDSEDLYQEALFYLWQQYNTGKLKNKNKSYILQGCYYYLKNHIRKYVKYKDCQINSNSYYNTENPDKDIDEGNRLGYSGSTTSGLDEYLYYDEFQKDLSSKEKVLLNLRLRGLSAREIGKELGVSHTMVLKMRKKMMTKYKTMYQ
jgi:DNA-directed RNA polymerase specialized sigma24 family protein